MTMGVGIRDVFLEGKKQDVQRASKTRGNYSGKEGRGDGEGILNRGKIYSKEQRREKIYRV